MIDLLALLDDDTVLQLISGKADSGSSHLFTIHQDTALHDQTAGLAVGSGQTGLDHEGQNADGAIGQIRFGQLSGRHVLSVSSTAEQGTGSVLGLLSLFLAVDHLGQLVGQDLLGLVQTLILPGAHLIDLLQRKEGQHPDALHHISIADIAPVLVEFKGIAPIVNPCSVPWGIKAFSSYLGEDKNAWLEWDSCALMYASNAQDAIPTLIDQGDNDQFLADQLQPAVLAEAARQKAWPMTLRIQPGYDHSYYFIASFIEDHLRFHAQHLLK